MVQQVVDIMRLNGSQLTPDLSNSVRLAMGLGQEIKKQRIQEAEAEEQMMIRTALGNKTVGEITSDPVSVQQLMRLDQLEPGSAKNVLQILAYGEDREKDELISEASEANRIYSNFEALAQTSLDDAKEYIKETIIQRRESGKDTAKMERLLTLPSDASIMEAQKLKALSGAALEIPAVKERQTAVVGDALVDKATGEVIYQNEPGASDFKMTKGPDGFDYWVDGPNAGERVLENYSGDTMGEAERLRIQNAQRNMDIEEGKLERDRNKLSAAAEKVLMTAQDEAYLSDTQAGRLESMAMEFENLDTSVGALGSAAGALKRISGNEDEVTELRKRYLALRNSQAVKNLPPGVASDKDIQLVLSGYLDETANPKTIASFLRGMAKIERENSRFQTFKSDWLSENGNTRGMLREWKRQNKRRAVEPAPATQDATQDTAYQGEMVTPSGIRFTVE